MSSGEGECSRGKRRNEGLLCIDGKGRCIKWKNLEDIAEIAPDLVCSSIYGRS